MKNKIGDTGMEVSSIRTAVFIRSSKQTSKRRKDIGPSHKELSFRNQRRKNRQA